MGDDLPDLPLFNRVAIAFSVPGAHPEITARADYVTEAAAGCGAVREICHLLMVAQQTWDSALRRFDT
jgi:3-deoxy-D-manno-octulosonate 8-phosphate phosphatase (KDO 8-P phosphatase)